MTMSFFERPHRLMCASSVVMGLKPETLREIDDFDVFTEKVKAELAATYGEQAVPSEKMDITYATNDEPVHFSSRITRELFERLREYRALLDKVDSVSKQLAEKVQFRELMESSISQDTEGGKALRQQQRDLRALKNVIAQLAQQDADLKYQVQCMAPQFANVFKAAEIRVSLG